MRSTTALTAEERQALSELLEVVERWLPQLPEESRWRLAFFRIRGGVLRAFRAPLLRPLAEIRRESIGTGETR